MIGGSRILAPFRLFLFFPEVLHVSQFPVPVEGMSGRLGEYCRVLRVVCLSVEFPASPKAPRRGVTFSSRSVCISVPNEFAVPVPGSSSPQIFPTCSVPMLLFFALSLGSHYGIVSGWGSARLRVSPPMAFRFYCLPFDRSTDYHVGAA